LLVNRELKYLGSNNYQIEDEFVDNLVSTDSDWTKTVYVKFPSFDIGSEKVVFAYWIKMQYVRQQNNIASPNTVFQIKNFLDGVYGGIFTDLNSVNPFNKIEQSKLGYINGASFDYISQTGLYSDANSATNKKVVLYAENAFVHIQSKNVFPKLEPNDLNEVKKTNSIVSSQVLPKSIIYNKWSAEESTGNFVDILEISVYNQNNETNVENLFFLGLTEPEFEALKNVSGLSTLHQRYLLFEEVSESEDVTTNLSFQKYKLKVQGLNTQGIVDIITPPSDIFVYGSNFNMLCSKDFTATIELPASTSPDSGIYVESIKHIYNFTYDKDSLLVTSLFPDGAIQVVDTNESDNGDTSPDVPIEAEVFHPVENAGDTIIGSEKKYPLIVIMHGNGQNYEDYNYYVDFCKYLSYNGFIVASINCQAYTKAPLVVIGGGYPSNYLLFIFDRQYYIYNNEPSLPPINNNYAYQKITLLEIDKRTGQKTSEALQPLIKDRDFEIILNAGIPKYFFIKKKDHGMASLGRANLLYPHLQILKNHFGSNVYNNIGIIGHSRGGEAVIIAANDIGTINQFDIANLSSRFPPLWKNVPDDLFNINAVVSLAPTDRYSPVQVLTGNTPFYVLYGSLDGDVIGPQQIDGTNQNRGSGFELYDRAQNDSDKTMSFVYRATHNGFITLNKTDIDHHDYGKVKSEILSESKQRRISMAYMNAFFRVHLKNEQTWISIFQGEQIPKSVGFKNIFQQYKKTDSTEFKTIQDFELPAIGTGVGQVSYSGQGSIEQGTLKSKDIHSPHDTKGLLVHWVNEGDLIFNISSAGQDINDFTYLSLRIAYKAIVVPAGAYNVRTDIPFLVDSISSGPYSNFGNFTVKLIDANSAFYEVENVVKIPEPYRRENIIYKYIPITTSYGIVNGTKSALMTIRIELSPFKNKINLTKITKLILHCPSGSGEILIDDVEFTK
jgi:hypothetical protein